MIIFLKPRPIILNQRKIKFYQENHKANLSENNVFFPPNYLVVMTIEIINNLLKCI